MPTEQQERDVCDAVAAVYAVWHIRHVIVTNETDEQVIRTNKKAAAHVLRLLRTDEGQDLLAEAAWRVNRLDEEC